ncbi:helix-turn-helix domain-containing protein [Devosia aquimaris]|uniref:helix-turn-helix domain-containing protein n=1 Tax=Devosia aquimaris TaxID=2866214 RepID=UPI001CD09C37|nr:helix-turn-helix domain-containing protein [Devosia sp. CJK-A8-3]
MSNLHATNPFLYTYQQAATLLGLKTVQALRDLVFRGKGPVPTRIGRRVFFTPADLQAWVDAHRDVPCNGDAIVHNPTASAHARRRGRPSVRERASRQAHRVGDK